MVKVSRVARFLTGLTHSPARFFDGQRIYANLICIALGQSSSHSRVATSHKQVHAKTPIGLSRWKLVNFQREIISNRHSVPAQ